MDQLRNKPDGIFEQDARDMNQLPARNTIERAGNIEFWRSICPQLSISEGPLGSHMKHYAVSPSDVQKVEQQVIEEGYFQVGPVVPRHETRLLADAVRTVVDHGFPASFVLVYDQVWQMLSRFENLLSPLGFSVSGFIRNVNEHRAESKEDSGWSPHRDGDPVISNMRNDGRPQILNVWIPFTDTTAEDEAATLQVGFYDVAAPVGGLPVTVNSRPIILNWLFRRWPTHISFHLSRMWMRFIHRFILHN